MIEPMSPRVHRRVRSAVRWLIPLALFASVASAQQESDAVDPWAGVEQMVVTGTSGFSELLTETSSVTAFDADTLEALGVEDIGDISKFTPNLNIVTGGTTSATLFSRGVGLNDFSPISTGAISVYQDDVPRGAAAILLGRLFDLENIIVLKGPQGTGPYRNASAGAIKIYPRQPSGDFGATLSVSYGNYDYIDVEGSIEAPLVPDILSNRTSFAVMKRGGWFKNRCGGAPPLSERTPIGGTQRFNVPPHSLCGESVAGEGDRLSDLFPGQATRINDRSNWALRSIFKLTPDEIDMIWSLNQHYFNLKDDSHVGQQIGIQDLQPTEFDDREFVRVGSGPPNNAGVRSYADANILSQLDELRTFYRAQCGEACDRRIVGRDAAAIANRRTNLLFRTHLARDLQDLDQDPFAGAVNTVGRTRNQNYGFALRGDVPITDAITLKSITGFEGWQRSILSDLDFTPNIAFETLSIDRGYQVSQELRLHGDLDDGQLGSWEIGGLVVADEVEVFAPVDNDRDAEFRAIPGVVVPLFREFDIIRDYEQKVLAIVGYAQGSWEFSETFGIDVGARWNYERKWMDYTLAPVNPNDIFAKEDIEFDSPTANLRFRYAPTESVSFYIMYNRGWKAGSYNATSNPNKGLTFADPERLDAYEFGWSFQLFDGRFTLDGAVFYYDYFNYQIFTAESNLSPQPEFVTINASSAEVYGAEIETVLTPFDGTMLRVNFGWLESKFLDFVQFQLGSRQDGNGGQQVFDTAIVNTNNQLLNSPRFTVSIIFSQTVTIDRIGDFTLNYNGAWTDDVFFDSTEGRGVPDSEERQVLSDYMIGEKAYWLHGMSLDFQPPDSSLTVTGWVRNMTNESYRNFSADLNSFLNTTIHFIGDPRTYGMTVTFDF